MRSVCFLTNEVYPVHRGGIGRMLHSIARHNEEEGHPVDIHFVIRDVDAPSVDDIRTGVDGLAEVHRLPSAEEHPTEFSKLVSLLPDVWDFTRPYKQSLAVYWGLLAIQRGIGRPFDVIEFPDFGGAGVASISAKQSGLAFENTQLTVRLHSSFGLITRHEKHYHLPSPWLGAVFDMERYQLRHADLVVGHVRGVVEANAEHYGFGDEWMERTRTEFPPVHLDDTLDGREGEDERRSQPRRFLFGSRLQPFKRPDLFVNAAVALVSDEPDRDLSFSVAAYGWDDEYLAYVRSLIPTELSDRIEFDDDVDQGERRRLIEESIVVIPSDYESLCLFAFEASMQGRPLILNGACEAFGASSRWIDGVNCLLFDGTVSGLQQAMLRALDWSPSAKVDATPTAPYWIEAPSSSQHVREPDEQGADDEMAVVCYGVSSRAQLARFAMEARGRDLGNAVLYAAIPTQPLGLSQHERRALDEDDIKPIALPGTGMSAREFHRVLVGLDMDLVAMWPADARPHPRFLRRAADAMRSQPDIDVFGSHVRRMDANLHEPAGVLLFAGEMPSTAMLGPSVAPRLLVVRRSTLLRRPFDDRARGAWLEVWLRELVLDGGKVLIAPMMGIDFIGDGDEPADEKRATASIRDDMGLRHGLISRLMALDVDAGWREMSRLRSVRIEAMQLGGARREWPIDDSTYNHRLTEYHHDVGGLLVHPVRDTIVMASVVAPPGSIRKLTAQVRNANAMNDGVQVAVAVASGISPAAASSGLAAGHRVEGVTVSDWVDLAPDDEGVARLVHLAPSSHQNSILLLSRLRPGASAHYAHAVFQQLDVWVEATAL